MALSKKLMAGGLAALALMATAGSAFAAPAFVTSNINVRSGPGTSYGVIDTIRRGERVDVQQCRGSWCYIEKRGPDGWVSSSYLERGGRPGWNDDYRPPVYDHRPPRPPRWDRPYRGRDWDGRPSRPYYPDRGRGDVCFDGPNSYVCIGD